MIGVRNIKVPGKVKRDPGWVAQIRGSCWDAIAVIYEVPRTGDRGDRSARVDFAYAVVKGVGNIEIPVRINSDVGGIK
jgi:hypothetical protein